MKTKIDYEKELNSRQLEAVKYFDSPLLVLAGAGSGKTRVITYKIVYMIDTLGFSPSSIVAVTFTNKASGEMKERVDQLLGEDTEVWIRTFHSLSSRLLRIYGARMGINPDFTIIDQNDQNLLVKNIISEMNLDPESYKPDRYVYLINRAKDRLLNVQSAFEENITRDRVFYDIYEEYQKRLEKENLLDFGDLLFKLVVGLKNHSDVLNELKGKIEYLLVDEFQDTNYAQYELVKILTLDRGNICIVGDDDQSIYGFRGARVENVLSFTKDYRGTKIIKLEENYRSYQTILSASSHLIDKNRDRLGKKLYTKKGKGHPLIFYRAASDYYEAVFIAKEIGKLMSLYGYSYSDFAVFFRTNAQSRIFESVFTNYRIPYKVVGGLAFYEREEIKDILAYIKLSFNRMDELSLRRIYSKPPRGIGPKSLDEIITSTIESGLPVDRINTDIFSGSRKRKVREFIELITEISDGIKSLTPPQLLKFIYEKSGYVEWLEKTGRDEKIRNLEELYNAVEDFYRENPDSTIIDFIEDVSLDRGAKEEDFYGGAVFLITLHNAKGLEFPVVFMAGMEDGLFPHYLADESNDIQEERRLCYVGMTRAKERLYLTAAETRRVYGRVINHNVSQFISEIPRELIVEASVSGFSNEWSSGNRVGVTLPKKEGYVSRLEGEKTGETGPGFKVGDRVVHATFGRGKIVSKEDDIVSILFDDGKRMRFMLKYTPLKKEQAV